MKNRVDLHLLVDYISFHWQDGCKNSFHSTAFYYMEVATMKSTGGS